MAPNVDPNEPHTHTHTPIQRQHATTQPPSYRSSGTLRGTKLVKQCGARRLPANASKGLPPNLLGCSKRQVSLQKTTWDITPQRLTPLRGTQQSVEHCVAQQLTNSAEHPSSETFFTPPPLGAASLPSCGQRLWRGFAWTGSHRWASPRTPGVDQTAPDQGPIPPA